MWKMSWCEVTKFGLECHWRCFLEIAKSWNVDIPLERGNPYDSNGATYVRIRGILREIWPFYGKLPEMESRAQGIPEGTLDIVWNVVRVPCLSGNFTGSTFILNSENKFNVGNYLRSFKEYKMSVGVIIWNVEVFNMILMQLWRSKLVRNWGGIWVILDVQNWWEIGGDMSHIVLATTQEVGIVGWCNNIKGREI